MSYCSTAHKPISLEMVHGLLMVSRYNNRRDGVTGMLLADGQRFLQTLEGPRSAVRALYKTIQTDPRHRCVVELMRTERVQERWYPSWSLGYLALSQPEMDDMVTNAVQKLQTEPAQQWMLSAHVYQAMLVQQDMTQPAPLDEPEATTA